MQHEVRFDHARLIVQAALNMKSDKEIRQANQMPFNEAIWNEIRRLMQPVTSNSTGLIAGPPLMTIKLFERILIEERNEIPTEEIVVNSCMLSFLFEHLETLTGELYAFAINGYKKSNPIQYIKETNRQNEYTTRIRLAQQMLQQQENKLELIERFNDSELVDTSMIVIASCQLSNQAYKNSSNYGTDAVNHRQGLMEVFRTMASDNLIKYIMNQKHPNETADDGKFLSAILYEFFYTLTQAYYPPEDEDEEDHLDLEEILTAFAIIIDEIHTYGVFIAYSSLIGLIPFGQCKVPEEPMLQKIETYYFSDQFKSLKESVAVRICYAYDDLPDKMKADQTMIRMLALRSHMRTWMGIQPIVQLDDVYSEFPRTTTLQAMFNVNHDQLEVQQEFRRIHRQIKRFALQLFNPDVAKRLDQTVFSILNTTPTPLVNAQGQVHALPGPFDDIPEEQENVRKTLFD